MFLSIDGTLIVQIINFVVFYAILQMVFVKPVGIAIAKRRAYLDSIAQDLEGAQGDAAAIRTQAALKRAQARREADESIVKARSEAQAEAARIQADFGARASTLVEAAHKTVESEVATANARVDALAKQLAETMLERTLPREAAR
jgi:F-type H+-transporting ATPase subunit b